MTKRDPKGEQAYSQWISQAGKAVLRLERAMLQEGLDDVMINSISIRAPEVEGGEFFAVVKGSYEGRRVVTFYSAPDLTSLQSGLAARFESGAAKWRDDNYAGQRNVRLDPNE